MEIYIDYYTILFYGVIIYVGMFCDCLWYLMSIWPDTVYFDLVYSSLYTIYIKYHRKHRDLRNSQDPVKHALVLYLHLWFYFWSPDISLLETVSHFGFFYTWGNIFYKM